MSVIEVRVPVLGVGLADDLDDRPRVRCCAMTRTSRGYEMCHRDEHGPEVRHHVRDRSWSTGGPTLALRLGQPCDPELCHWPEQVTPYLGYKPNESDVRAERQARRTT